MAKRNVILLVVLLIGYLAGVMWPGPGQKLKSATGL